MSRKRASPSSDGDGSTRPHKRQTRQTRQPRQPRQGAALRLQSMVDVVGGSVFRVVVNNTVYDGSKGKFVTRRQTAIAVTPQFFGASRCTRGWVGSLESEGGDVQVHTVCRDNIEDVYWPRDIDTKRWLPLAPLKLQLYKCTFTEQVAATAKSSKSAPPKTKEVHHHVLVASKSLGQANEALGSIMTRLGSETRAKDVKRTAVETVLTMQDEDDEGDDDDDDDAEDLGAEDTGDEAEAEDEEDEAAAAVQVTPPANSAHNDAFRAAVGFAVQNAPEGGPRVTVRTVVEADPVEGAAAAAAAAAATPPAAVRETSTTEAVKSTAQTATRQLNDAVDASHESAPAAPAASAALPAEKGAATEGVGVAAAKPVSAAVDTAADIPLPLAPPLSVIEEGEEEEGELAGE